MSSENAELEAKHQKYKGRVALRGDIVKDDSGSYAVLTEQGSSASQTEFLLLDTVAPASVQSWWDSGYCCMAPSTRMTVKI